MINVFKLPNHRQVPRIVSRLSSLSSSQSSRQIYRFFCFHTSIIPPRPASLPAGYHRNRPTLRAAPVHPITCGRSLGVSGRFLRLTPLLYPVSGAIMPLRGHFCSRPTIPPARYTVFTRNLRANTRSFGPAGRAESPQRLSVAASHRASLCAVVVPDMGHFLPQGSTFLGQPCGHLRPPLRKKCNSLLPDIAFL